MPTRGEGNGEDENEVAALPNSHVKGSLKRTQFQLLQGRSAEARSKPSALCPKPSALISPDRGERVDTRRAPRGEVGRDRAHEPKRQWHRNECRRVRGAHA